MVETPMATKLTTSPSGSPDKLWRCEDPLDYVQTMPRNEGNPLDQIYKRMQEYDQDMFKAWRDEIEHLLIFAGLFSATLTAFLVDSYKWLQPDFNKTSVLLLSQISIQLAGIANNATSLVSPDPHLLATFTPEHRPVRINIMWFVSLILCLSTVIFGILCLQWLREYTSGMSFSPSDAITIRQMRFDGLERWKVPTFITLLPIMLQISVLLFFAGILDLLWPLHVVVASIIMGMVGLVVVMIVFTTTAPVIQTLRDFYYFDGRNDPDAFIAPCPYRSPISRGILYISMLFYSVLFRQGKKGQIPSRQRKEDPILPQQRKEDSDLLRKWEKLSSWADFDVFFHKSSMTAVSGKKPHNTRGLARALAWMMSTLSPELNQGIPRDIYHSLHSSLDKPTSKEVLRRWAATETQKVTTTSEELRLSVVDQAHYDLWMERLLRQCSPVHRNRGLLLELQVRCLNTFGDNNEMIEVFYEAASHCYYYCLENPELRCLNDDANSLVYQALMALLKRYNHLHNRSGRYVSDHTIGSVLASVIQKTQVTKGNAPICYAILKQFRSLLEEIYQEAGDLLYPSPHLNLYSITQLLHELDLKEVERWQTGIQNESVNEVSVVVGLASFTEKLIPVLEKNRQVREANDMRSQLDAFRQHRPHTYVYTV